LLPEGRATGEHALASTQNGSRLKGGCRCGEGHLKERSTSRNDASDLAGRGNLLEITGDSKEDGNRATENEKEPLTTTPRRKKESSARISTIVLITKRGVKAAGKERQNDHYSRVKKMRISL